MPVVGMMGIVCSFQRFDIGRNAMPDVPIMTIILGVGFTLLMAIVGIAITVGIILWIRKSYGSGAVDKGVSAPATILRIWDTGTTINENPLVGFQLQVTPEYGEPFQAECKQMVSRLEVGNVQPGGSVTVSYDPKNPKKIKITGLNAPVYPYGAPAAPAQANPTELQRKLEKIDADNQAIVASGQSAQAEVMRYSDWNVKVNGDNPAVTLQLRVLPPGQSPFMAEVSGVISVSSVPRFQPGRTIWVKYDPNDLTRVAIEHS